MNAPDSGLCAQCVHSKEIRTDRGSAFTMCLRSFSEPQYPKYPRLPVLTCAGFEAETISGPPYPTA